MSSSNIHGRDSISSHSQPLRESRSSSSKKVTASGHDFATQVNPVKTKLIIALAIAIFYQLSKAVYKATSFINNKSVNINVQDENFNNKSVSIQLPYPRNVKIHSSDISQPRLNKLFEKPYGYQALLAAAKDGFAEENIYLLNGLKHLQQLLDNGQHNESRHVASQLKKLFVDNDAPLKANLGSKIVAEFLSHYKNPSSVEFRQCINEMSKIIQKLVGEEQFSIDAFELADQMAALDEQRKADMNHIINEIGL